MESMNIDDQLTIDNMDLYLDDIVFEIDSEELFISDIDKSSREPIITDQEYQMILKLRKIKDKTIRKIIFDLLEVNDD